METSFPRYSLRSIVFCGSEDSDGSETPHSSRSTDGSTVSQAAGEEGRE